MSIIRNSGRLSDLVGRLGAGCHYTRLLPLVEGLVSWQAVTWVLEQSKARLGSRLVLLSIASHANREGKQSYPSVKTICLESRLSRREVQYALRDLEESGELRTMPARGSSNRYAMPEVANWLGAQTLRMGAQPSAQGGAQPSAPEPSFEPTLTVNTAQKRRVHSPEKIRQIEAKQKRLRDENEVAKEVAIGRGPMCTDQGILSAIRNIARSKQL